METRPRLQLIVVAVVVVALCAPAAASQRLPVSYHGGAASFNVKNYGAKGNGVTDDTKVRTYLHGVL